jgi:hypothetical protein
VVLLFPALDWATIGQQLSRFRMVSLVIEPRKAHGKSRVTNRPNELLVEPVDKRSAAVRRFKDVLAAIVSDLEGANRQACVFPYVFLRSRCGIGVNLPALHRRAVVKYPEHPC